MKRQNTNWEKIFINFISISRVYKDQLQINNRKRKTSVKNSQDFNRLLIREDIRMANKYL